MKKSLFFSVFFLYATALLALTDTTAVDTFQFTIVKENPISSVKNQQSAGTCWSYSGLALFESEMIRMGKPAIDLSNMFVVHHSYNDKARKYVRTHGKVNFSQGGSFHDVIYVLKHYGIVPESVKPGMNYGEDRHNHSELEGVTKAFVDVIIRNPNRKLSTAWEKAFQGITEAYLGELPKTFKYEGKEYTPQSFMKSTGLNMDDYVSLTSYMHHPFYSSFALEIPDNWRWGESYNLPLNEFAAVFDHAINNGYTIAWGSDVSERGFSRNGVAVNPIIKIDELPGSDQARWLGLSQREIEDKIFKSSGPQPEIEVTQELRQEGYDNYQTTDDHGMQIYGIVKDQNGTKYYMVKNSWGTDSKYKGIWYASESFVLHKTMNIVVHRNAIPKDIRKKLKL
jgi:aminopeptidase C